MQKFLLLILLSSLFITCKQNIKPVIPPSYPKTVLHIDTAQMPRFKDKKVNSFLEEYTLHTQKLIYAIETKDTIMINELGKLKQEWGTRITAISQKLERNKEESKEFYDYVNKLIKKQKILK